MWDPDQPLPPAAEIPWLEDVRFTVVKAREPEVDGYNWLHGAAVCWHGGLLYASFGHNRGSENTETEEARGRVSSDGGRTWGELFTMDPGEDNLAVSHGVFLSHEGQLWAFMGAFYDRFQRTLGMATGLALNVLQSPVAALGSAVFGPWSAVTSSVVASYWRRQSLPETPPPPAVRAVDCRVGTDTQAGGHG